MPTEQTFSDLPSVTGGIDYRPRIAAQTAEVGVIRSQVKDLDGNARKLHERTMSRELEARSSSIVKLSASELLARLNDYGFAWRDVARMVGVSVPAVQKWRRGDSITGENRLKLARMLATVEMVVEKMVADPASWFEVPLLDSAITPIDLVTAGDVLLVVELASEHIDAQSALDQFDPQWREKYRNGSFESFMNADGVRSVRSRD